MIFGALSISAVFQVALILSRFMLRLLSCPLVCCTCFIPIKWQDLIIKEPPKRSFEILLF